MLIPSNLRPLGESSTRGHPLAPLVPHSPPSTYSQLKLPPRPSLTTFSSKDPYHSLALPLASPFSMAPMTTGQLQIIWLLEWSFSISLLGCDLREARTLHLSCNGYDP
jgi:hypothetical protein